LKKSFSLVLILMVLAVVSSAQAGVSAQSLSPADAPKRLTVPEGNGKPVLLDGIFAPGEWDDALKVPIHDRIDLFLKKIPGTFSWA
jgi:hypothetical protein